MIGINSKIINKLPVYPYYLFFQKFSVFHNAQFVYPLSYDKTENLFLFNDVRDFCHWRTFIYWIFRSGTFVLAVFVIPLIFLSLLYGFMDISIFEDEDHDNPTIPLWILLIELIIFAAIMFEVVISYVFAFHGD